MKLYKAIEGANDGDMCKVPNYNGFTINKSCHKILNPITGKPFLFCPRDFERDDWEIIRAEPEVLTSEELRTKQKIPDKVTAQDVSVWDLRSLTDRFYVEGTKNGQIKEWKRLKPLIEMHTVIESLLLELKDRDILLFPMKTVEAHVKELKNLTPPWEPEK